jgi:hypothetical protein
MQNMYKGNYFVLLVFNTHHFNTFQYKMLLFFYRFNLILLLFMQPDYNISIIYCSALY